MLQVCYRVKCSVCVGGGGQQNIQEPGKGHGLEISKQKKRKNELRG
jgi:hypothetical protein